MTAMALDEQHQSAASEGCQYWLPMKRRCCGWKCKEGQQYCGNHLFAVTGAGEERVPCPANPKHDVPVSQLKAHLKKCPEAVRAAAARAQPYFCENLNTGADLIQQHQQQHNTSTNSADQQAAAATAAAAAAIAAEACASFLKGTAEQRTAAAIAKGPEWFQELMRKIDVARAALTAEYPLSRQLLGGCEGDMQDLFNFSRELDPLMPFDRKHAAQHASIVDDWKAPGLLVDSHNCLSVNQAAIITYTACLYRGSHISGNMEAAGLLDDPQNRVYVELGAGKGFLTAWLHQVSGANELILLDRQGNFIKKADRRLRHTRLTRVAVDLKDAALLPLMQLHLRGSPPVTAKQREHQQRLDRVHQQSQAVHQQHLRQEQQRQLGFLQKHERSGLLQQLSAVQETAVGDKGVVSEVLQQDKEQGSPAVAGQHSAAVDPSQARPETLEPHCQLNSLESAVAQEPGDSPALLLQQKKGEASMGSVHQLGTTDAQARGVSGLLQTSTGPEAVYQVASSNKRLKNTSFGGLICCPAEPRGFATLQQQATDSAIQQLQEPQQDQMPWVAHGKHLCGAATDFALRACYNAVVTTFKQDCNSGASSSTAGRCNSSLNGCKFGLRGLAIATCCHHRCGWAAYCGREVLEQYGIGRTEFETIAWLTSWALCGHESAPGAGDDSGDETQQQQEQHPSPQQAQQAQPTATAATGSSTTNIQPKQQPAHQVEYHPADLLDRPSRIALGLKCKQLIDAGRCSWIQQALIPALVQQRCHAELRADVGAGDGLVVQRITYIDQAVTGENTLLVVGQPSTCT